MHGTTMKKKSIRISQDGKRSPTVLHVHKNLGIPNDFRRWKKACIQGRQVLEQQTEHQQVEGRCDGVSLQEGAAIHDTRNELLQSLYPLQHWK